MFGSLSFTHLLIILVIILLIFGPSRLGDLGSSLGKAIKGFKRAMREPDEIDVTPSKDEASRIESTRLENTGKAAGKKEEAK